MHPLAVDLRGDLAGVLRQARLLADARTRFSDAACSTDETLRWLALGGIASGIETTYSGMERLLRRIAA
jgi:hypothetical protein